MAGLRTTRAVAIAGMNSTVKFHIICAVWLGMAGLLAGVSRAAPASASHWAFQPLPTAVAPPPARASDRNEIDAFIREGLAAAGLAFAPAADRTSLVRRVFLDMHGLPPTPERVAEFIGAVSPDAYEQLVAEVLASPRYGERWAQHWLDVVRYADTHGYEVNTPRPNAWPYRDYVIESFNTDKPYNQFVYEQFAGDSVDNDAATGFLVASAVLLPGQIGADDASKRQARQDALDEMIVATGETFLGLTVGCARCHDHKFDPIPQKDYYAMQAFFAGVEYEDRPIQNADTRARNEEAEKLKNRIAALNLELAKIEPKADVGLRQEPSPGNDSPAFPILRPPVNPLRNSERFDPIEARFIRFTTFATENNNQYEPCLDELEVFAAGSETNLALAQRGTRPTSSGDFNDPNSHKLEHINDGQYGNGRSWISNSKGGGWVQLELPQLASIDRIVWARDRDGKFKDRLAVRYRIEVALEPGNWRTVASSEDRAPYGKPFDEEAYWERVASEDTRPGVLSLIQERKKAERKRRELAEGQLVFAGTFREPDLTHVLYRGDPEQKRERVEPAAPSLFANRFLEPSTTEQSRRTALGKWIASPDNPLTARVMANRVWQYHFGRGLVETPSDFGLNGARPTHPELLDWLAIELVRSGWSIKHLHRLILLSASYRQSNRIHQKAQTVDGDCRLLWRFPSRRLEAEAIRDSILAVSGELNLKMGGPGFNFFKSRGGLDGFPPVEEFTPVELRRMVFAHKVRMERVPVFGAFDCPDAGQPLPRRQQSTTAIQALNLFNSPFVHTQAEALAARLKREAPQTLEAQIARAFQLALGRLPNKVEAQAAEAAAREHGMAALGRVLFNSNEFLFLP